GHKTEQGAAQADRRWHLAKLANIDVQVGGDRRQQRAEREKVEQTQEGRRDQSRQNEALHEFGRRLAAVPHSDMGETTHVRYLFLRHDPPTTQAEPRWKPEKTRPPS